MWSTDSIALALHTVRPMPHLKDILEAKGRWHMRQTPPLQYLQGLGFRVSHKSLGTVAAALQNKQVDSESASAGKDCMSVISAL